MELSVQKREKLDKAAKVWLKEGLIPAEFYGHNMSNVHLAVPVKDFEKIFREAGENTVINLLLEKESRPALVHEVQRDFLTGSVRHIDFYGIRMDEEIKAPVVLEFEGESAAIKDKGGILNKALLEMEVEALPADLPHKIVVDISPLNEIGESIYIKDLKIPAKVKIFLEPDTVVATITPPREEEVEEKPMEVSEVKVETEEKAAERAQEKEAEIKNKTS